MHGRVGSGGLEIDSMRDRYMSPVIKNGKKRGRSGLSCGVPQGVSSAKNAGILKKALISFDYYKW